MHEIGKNLKELRVNKGISIRELGQLIGISHNTLASYERYDIVPTILNAVKICEFFKVPVEFLVNGKLAITDFNDGQLLKLFKMVDSYKEEDKELAKQFLKKLVKNVEQRGELEEEVKIPKKKKK
jgi:transcriptional regulator with XRE-family HTH domain